MQSTLAGTDLRPCRKFQPNPFSTFGGDSLHRKLRIPQNHGEIDKKLSYRREAARCLVLLSILVSRRRLINNGDFRKSRLRPSTKCEVHSSWIGTENRSMKNGPDFSNSWPVQNNHGLKTWTAELLDTLHGCRGRLQADVTTRYNRDVWSTVWHMLPWLDSNVHQFVRVPTSVDTQHFVQSIHAFFYYAGA